MGKNGIYLLVLPGPFFNSHVKKWEEENFWWMLHTLCTRGFYPIRGEKMGGKKEMRRFVIEDALRGNDRKPTDIICFLSTKFPPTPRLLDSYFFALCSCFSRQKTFEIIIETLSTLLFFLWEYMPRMDGWESPLYNL
jgi:hypothetical protein